MVYFDSHAHYYDERFASEFPGGAEAAIQASKQAGVKYILNAGTCPETTRAAIQLAHLHDGLYASAGIHPGDSLSITDELLPRALDEIRSLSEDTRCVAIGEIGLDYYWDPDGKARQKRIFDAQLSMAEELSLPVIIHDREAHGDTFDLLRLHPRVTGVLHSFSGSAEMARQLSDLGWYISFSGPITYKTAEKVREAAAKVPLTQLLIETDAPYLPPVPHRGKINFSAYLPHTAEALALATGVSPDEIAAITTENAKRIFRI